MFVADNGSDWFVSGAPDPRWSDDRLGDLKDIPGDAFEVVDTGEVVITEEDQDYDGDGYTNATETHVGTGTGDPCGQNGWRSDLVSSGASYNKLTIEDAASFVAPMRRLGTSPGHADYRARWDLVPGTTVGSHINVQDLAALFSGPTGYPPMLGGQRAFGEVYP